MKRLTVRSRSLLLHVADPRVVHRILRCTAGTSPVSGRPGEITGCVICPVSFPVVISEAGRILGRLSLGFIGRWCWLIQVAFDFDVSRRLGGGRRHMYRIHGPRGVVGGWCGRDSRCGLSRCGCIRYALQHQSFADVPEHGSPPWRSIFITTGIRPPVSSSGTSPGETVTPHQISPPLIQEDY